MQVWVKQKAQETWQFLSPLIHPQPFYLFHRPSVPFSLLKEHTASLFVVSPLCCYSLLFYASLPNLRWSLFTSQFAQNGQWRKHVLHFVSSVFIMSCLLSLAVFTPLPCTQIANQWWKRPGTLFLGHLSSYEKALTSTTKHGSWTGRQQDKKRKENTNGKEKNCLIRASGEEVGNTYAHPWFLPGRPPRQQFSSFLTLR